jgi:hypothetical protein
MLRRPGVWLDTLHKEGRFSRADRSSMIMIGGGPGTIARSAIPPPIMIIDDRRGREPSAPQVAK